MFKEKMQKNSFKLDFKVKKINIKVILYEV